MTKRIFRAMIAVLLLVTMASLLLLPGMLRAYFEDRSFAELAEQAAYVARGLEESGAEYFEGLASESRIIWVSADGNVLYDTHETAEAIESMSARSEIQAALSKGEGRAEAASALSGRKEFYYALRLYDGSVLRFSDTQTPLGPLILSVSCVLVCIALAGFGLAAMFASRTAEIISSRINGIDPAEPEGNAACWKEVTPLLDKIRSQNRELRRQMEQLRRRQDEFSEIMGNMSEGILVLDCKAMVLSYNAAALKLLHAENGNAAGEISAYQLNREAGFRRCVEQALAGRRSEQLLEDADSCRQIIASPVFQERHLTGAVLVILDVTEKEQRDSLRREFTANVSHELKTPLTSILGTAEIMYNGIVQPADIPRFAKNIYTETGRLIQLVNDIIRLSRLDEGGSISDWEDIELYALSANVLEQVAQAAERKGVTLHLEGEAATVRGVPQIMEEVIYNLCDNAVAYNRAGGSVTVEVRREDDGVALTVTDTGIGIPAAARDRIFERFYRVDKSHSSEGTGLGLSIVKHGAAYLGAKIQLKSEEGKGSTFRLLFSSC